MISDPNFKEDSVREEILFPLLSALGYSAFSDNKIIRSPNLKHPYVHFGTKKESVYMIPDYLLQVEGKNVMVIDAKSPKENILKGKNIEQVYSYAIHREVRVPRYGLCNGNEIVIYDVNNIEPIFYSKIQDLEENWEELYKVMSPFSFTNPHICNYNLDYGIHFMKIGWEDVEHHFYSLWVNNLIRIDEDYYTFSSVIPHGEEDYFASFDFHKDLLSDFIAQIPANKKNKVIEAITSYPFNIGFDSESESFKVSFRCELSKNIITNENEIYCPFRVIKFD